MTCRPRFSNCRWSTFFAISAALPVLLLMAPTALFAQPVIVENGIVNAATFIPPSLPGGSIAQGSIFSIFGANLGPVVGTDPPPRFPLETTLAGVSIAVTGGGTTVNAIPVFVLDRQINAIMPSNAPLGPVQVTVTFNGQTSAPAPVTVVNSSVGIFTLLRTGAGPGAITNFIDAETRPPTNTTRVTARPGQFVTAWATGMGPINASDQERPSDVGAVVDLRKPRAALREPGGSGPAAAVDLAILVGNAAVTNIFYAGRSAEFPGLDQIIFQVPAGAPEGCFVPVRMTTDGVPSNGVTMSIQRDGQPCSDTNPLSQTVIEGGRFGSIALLRVDAEVDLGPPLPALDVMLDTFTGGFGEQPGGEITYNPLFSLPPVGSCASITTALDLGDVVGGDLPDVDTGTPLDAGTPLTIMRQGGATKMVPGEEGAYVATLGGGIPLGGPIDPLFLDPGVFTISGPGGADVGPFQVDVTIPTGAAWTNRAQLGNVNRGQGVTYRWSNGGPNELLVLAGGNVNTVTNVAGAFFCLANASAGEFAVNPVHLAGIPPSLPPAVDGTPVTLGFLLLGSLPSQPTPFQATGLDGGLVVTLSLNARTSTFQ